MLQRDVFGAVSMGYVVIESDRLDAWRRFCVDGLGLHLAQRERNTLAFRMDDHASRILVERGSAEDVVALGWEFHDEAALETVLARLQERKIPVTELDPSVALARGVDAAWRLDGPKGLSLELFTAPKLVEAPLSMLTSGFVTGIGGLGHAAIISRRPEAMLRFWKELFDARVSDFIEDNVGGITIDLTFLRLNERHHTLAIGTTRGVRIDPIRTQVQHINVLGATVEDLTDAHQRCRDLGFEIAHGIGQHPNDKELSFYVVSPSGFEVEFGWNAITVDESDWQPTIHRGISVWGHRPEDSSPFAALALNGRNFWHGVLSLLKPELSPLPEEHRRDWK
ncbi:MAG: VOC family protein [Myxococcota bacterium]